MIRQDGGSCIFGASVLLKRYCFQIVHLKPISPHGVDDRLLLEKPIVTQVGEAFVSIRFVVLEVADFGVEGVADEAAAPEAAEQVLVGGQR